MSDRDRMYRLLLAHPEGVHTEGVHEFLAAVEWPTRSDSPAVAEVDRGHGSDCWIFGGHLHHTGYGMLRRSGKTYWAHRWFYEKVHGMIPPKLVIDHLCEQHDCVNPSHLKAVTNAENVRRGKAKLTEQQVREIRSSDLGCVRAAREFGVAKATILGIRAGRRWKDVT